MILRDEAEKLRGGVAAFGHGKDEFLRALRGHLNFSKQKQFNGHISPYEKKASSHLDRPE